MLWFLPKVCLGHQPIPEGFSGFVCVCVCVCALLYMYSISFTHLDCSKVLLLKLVMQGSAGEGTFGAKHVNLSSNIRDHVVKGESQFLQVVLPQTYTVNK